jgi:hypothetical protein
MHDVVRSNVLLRIKKNPYCVARNTTCYELLKSLIQHPNADVRLAAISNDLIDPAMLSELSKDLDHYVRYSVAIHPLTRRRDLSKLSYDVNALVRKGVSENMHYYFGPKAKAH